MRNFEERKEEIFRRSQVRIAKRRKTAYRVIAACVPVVLCVSVVSGYLLLGGFGMKSAAPEANMSPNYSMQDCVEENMGVAMDPLSMQIGNGTDARTCTDPVLLQLFADVAADQAPGLEAPESATEPVTESTQESDTKYGAAGSKCPSAEDIIDAEPYPIAVTYMDGTTVWFTLRGNRLTREDGQTCMLTDEQAAALRAFLEEIP